MYKDEIIDEIWKNREAYAAKHHHDLTKMVLDIKNRQKSRDINLQTEENKPCTVDLAR